jgi:cytochrome c oxidase assembly protein subunit 11
MRDAITETAPTSLHRKHRTVALACTAFFLTMFGAAFAAVPLYDWFCRATGLGGTTQVASQAPVRVLDRTMTVRFDANVAPGLAWRFEPVATTVRVRLGEPHVATYRVRNLASVPTTGTASYNVTPLNAGIYFHKIQCFCFTEQTLQPGETQEFTVSFFVDPELADDRGMVTLDTITLSYTFFATRTQQRPVAEAPRASAVQ